MFALNAFGGIMAFIPGVAGVHVWTLAIGSGVAGSIGWIFQRQQAAAKQSTEANFWGVPGQQSRRTQQIALGASGAVMGMGATANSIPARSALLVE